MRSRKTTTGPPPPYLGAVRLVADELAQVEARLGDLCGAGHDVLAKAARAAVEAGGKRLRPALVLLSSKALGGPTDSVAIELAAAVEVMHLASLMHDDVVDEATLRRGRPSVRQRWGNRTAVLLGDYLGGRVYAQLTAVRDWRYVQIFAETALKMCTAEASFSQALPDEVTLQDCLAVAEGKTASLTATACQVGALSAPEGERYADVFRDYGKYLGLAFQITDDLLDIYGTQEATGKLPGRDILTGQLTLPVVAALNSDMGSEVRQVITQIGNAEEPEAFLGRLGQLVESSGGRAQAERTASQHTQQAIAGLADVPAQAPEAIDALTQIARTLTARKR